MASCLHERPPAPRHQIKADPLDALPTRALLDVNVLIALLDEAHIGHGRALEWLQQHIAAGWASCPITQNGCIRIMSQPAYPGALPAAAVAERMAEATRDPSHAFWPDDFSLLDGRSILWPRILGHRQVTDLYLLASAVRQGGQFVTFERRIDLAAVPGAAATHLVML